MTQWKTLLNKSAYATSAGKNLHLDDNKTITLNPISTQFSHETTNKPEKKTKIRQTGNPIRYRHRAITA